MIRRHIRDLAKERGLTMCQVADAAGITRSNLYRILGGQKPRFDTLVKLAKALNVEPHELIGGASPVAALKVEERLKLLVSVCLGLKEDSLLRVVWYARYERDAA